MAVPAASSEGIVPSGQQVGGVHVTVALSGPVDVTSLRAALAALAPASDVPRMAWQRTEVRDRPANRRRAVVAAAIARATTEPFDLSTGPLVRANLFQLGANTAVLHLALSALVADEASAGPLVTTLAVNYRLLRVGHAPVAPVEWRLRPVRPQPRVVATATGRGGCAQRVFRAGTLSTMESMWGDPAAALLTAWHTVLARFTAAAEVVLDVAIGAGAAELPVRLDYDPSLSFQDAVRRHAGVPPAGEERIVSARNVFRWLDLPPDVVADGTRFRVDAVRSTAITGSLRLTACPRGRELTVVAVSGCGSDADPDGLLDGLSVLLDAAIARPDTRLAALPLLTAPQERLILTRFNATERHWPDPAVSFPAAFAAQVARTPDAVAVSGPDGTVCYADLARRSAWLAWRLRSIGVGVGDAVALCPTTSLPTVAVLVGLLAILRSGAVYVPIDCTDPPARQVAAVVGLGVSVVLTDRPTVVSFGDGARVMGLDADGATPETIRDPDLSGTQAAYVVHTSGSTGVPKGVVVAHDSLLNYLRWVNAELVGDLVLPAVTRPTFDASLKQLLAPLIRGGRVWLLPQDALDDPDVLYGAMCEQRRTGAALGFNCVPSLWDALLTVFESMADPDLPDVLHRVLLGGEALPESLLARTAAILPRTEVWNVYGPTEGTANATACRVTANSPVTIGHPLANTHAFVLDRELRPVPVGARGDLYLGGAGVARGYAGRPRETAERFRPNPFGGLVGGPGSRIYHTGDVARYDRNGEIEYLGRTDLQVKIRGFRIELTAVEAALGACPGVREAAVTAVQNTTGTRRLVGVVVASADVPFQARELRAQLVDRLPPYAVPAELLAVDALPRTSTGKVDRRALTRLVLGRADHAR